MLFDYKTNRSQRIRIGKALFFRFYGNIRLMSQEGVYKEYKNLKIPKEIEAKWRKEIFEELKNQIDNEKKIPKKIVLIGSLLEHGIEIKSIVFLIIDILTKKMDTFSRILLCEHLKKCYFYNQQMQSLVRKELNIQKNYMINTDITIDDYYIELSYMSGYDFSNTNIKKRIEAL